MSDVEKYAKGIKKLNLMVNDLTKEMKNIFGGSTEWAIGEVMESYLSLYARFCPFNIGDRVELVENITMDEHNPGWHWCAHFLVKGAKATVKDRGYSDSVFTFDVVFDNESWVDDDGVVKPVSRKHTFCISEYKLKRVNLKVVEVEE